MNILVVTQFIPMPDRQADMLRLVEILRIAAIDHSISLLATDIRGQERRFGGECVAECRTRLEPLGIRFCTESEAVAPGEDYEMVLFEAYPLAHSRLARMRYRFPRSLIVIDTVDIGYLRLASQERAAVGRTNLSASVKALRNVELRTYAAADVVVAISELESAHLRSLLPNLHVHVIPLIIDAKPLLERPLSSGRLVFVGNFDHQANVDAVRWMIDEIFPIIRESIPEARFIVLGNRPPPDLTTDTARGIKIVGFVHDLGPHYEAADISVAPLTWGGGLKGKVAQAMAYGLPVVTTTVGASGFNLKHRKHALIADSASEFANAVIQLHTDGALRRSIGVEGHALVVAHYAPQNVGKAVAELCSLTGRISPASLSSIRQAGMAFKIAFHRHLGWRLERETG